MMRSLWVAWALVLLLVAHAAADEFKPAYLEVRQTSPDTISVLWRLPALDEGTTLRVRPVFPPGSVELTPRRASFAAGASVQRWSMRVAGGLEGRSIEFDGLARARLDVLVRVERIDGTVQLGRVLPGSTTFTVDSSPGPWEVAATYTGIGIEHILLGIDHLLFVLALLMIVQGPRKLLLTITAFTLAHSITLALATLHIVRVPGPPVEALIAMSIVYVAVAILRRERGHEDLTSRQPWIVAFLFGLLHGLGFAGALAEVGLPENAVALALVFFNVGVEIGQLCFVAMVLLAAHAVRGYASGRRVAIVAPAYFIGGIASYWGFERLAAFPWH